MMPRDGTLNYKHAWYPEMELQTSMVPRDETINMPPCLFKVPSLGIMLV
jgi:hypothetical protein